MTTTMASSSSGSQRVPSANIFSLTRHPSSPAVVNSDVHEHPPQVRSITGAVRSRREGRRHPAAGVLDPPLDHRTQDGAQILSLRRQLILDARRVITVTTRLDDAETD